MSFKDYLLAKYGTTQGTLLDRSRRPVYVPAPKVTGARVLGSGGVWETVA